MNKPVRFERSYEAPIEDLWELWTTKEGFESWWGPEGFRVEVHEIDPRVGGKLFYDMIAVGAEQIQFLNDGGHAQSHETRGVFVELVPLERLKLRHIIDFIPGVQPYDNDMLVEFFRDGKNVRMVVTIEPHAIEEMTRMSAQGFESSLTKIPAALSRR